LVSEIDVLELKAKMDAGEIFKLVEVSNQSHYDEGHLSGAIQIPLEGLQSIVLKRFRKFQQIVIYCEEAKSSVGLNAVRFLQHIGFSNVILLRGGKEAWRAAGLPIQKDSRVNGQTTEPVKEES
ncbi:rhodanese-like domain-containing protein, partial [bacterium]|nr:rhodanese-like domain-containing protein [bacterium]